MNEGRLTARRVGLVLVCPLLVCLAMLLGCGEKKEKNRIDNLRLSREVLADIFLGKITKWNDPAIKRDNYDVDLPDQDITVVHRSEGSGTTYIFTDYLCQVSDEWKQKVGNKTEVKWPAEGSKAGKGNAGVASYVDQIEGSIGYVEYAYALENKMITVQLRNKAGNWVKPGSETFAPAAAGADWENAKNFRVSMNNRGGEKTWPIVGPTYILFPKKPKDAARAQQVLKFFDFAYEKGDEAAEKLHYVPLPKTAINLIRKSWEKLEADGKPLWPTRAEPAKGMTLEGQGATFPAPVYQQWAELYAKETGVKLNYQPVGSGGGIKAVKDKQGDFGASDAPQTDEELKKLDAVQFPTVVGGVVLVFNLKSSK